jgi:serine/threonine-protein kinase
LEEGTLERLKAALAGRYAIQRELGRGGMAVVYLARDERHQRAVALKVMSPDIVLEGGAERFRREIHIAARLSHPHILTVFDSGEADGLFFYVMPFVEGESLREAITRERQIGIAEAVAITRQVADALDYAHAEGVIHRDIKPANILLTRSRSRSGGPRNPLVTDFGIARAVSGEGATRLTSTGLLVGTPSYMSPEQWSGEALSDGRSDQYSLACVLYEMLIGEPPFTGPTPMVVLARHSMEMVPSLRIARPNVPEALEHVIWRAMAKVPADRFATMADFADAVAEAVNGAGSSITTDHPVTSGTDAAEPAPVSRERTQPRISRPEQGPPSGVPGPPPAAPVSAPAPRIRRGRRMVLLGAVGLVLIGAGIAGILNARNDPPERTRLLVLPFRNRGDTTNESFTDGLTEELISRLSGVKRLGVVARASAMTYKGAVRKASELGRELDVHHIVDGTVTWQRRATGGLRATVRVALVRASDDESLWDDDFPLESLEDLYSAQGEIATQVAARLDVNLVDSERRRMMERPTLVEEAYEAYRQGNHFFNRSWDSSDVNAAIAEYDKATRLDPKFALAFAALGRAHAWKFQLGIDPVPSRLVAAREKIDSALRIAPDLPEGHLARGLYYYWSTRDYERALKEFEVVREALPSSAEAFNFTGNIERRQGAWRDAIEHYRLAAELDPRSHQTLFNRAESHLYLREYDLAAPLADRVTSLAPDFIDGWILRAALVLQRTRDRAGARRVLDEAAGRIPPTRWRAIGHQWRSGLFRILDDSLSIAERRTQLGAFGLDTAHYLIARAEMYRRFERTREARVYYDSARRYMEATVANHPEWGSAFGRLGLSQAGLGNAVDAVRNAEKAVQMLPVSGDALDGPEWLANVASIHAMTGNTDQAIAWLDRAMRIPSRLSPTWLELDPSWDGLRSDPRFQRLVREPPPFDDPALRSR